MLREERWGWAVNCIDHRVVAAYAKYDLRVVWADVSSSLSQKSFSQVRTEPPRCKISTACGPRATRSFEAQRLLVQCVEG
jgi:hypothetical protein